LAGLRLLQTFALPPEAGDRIVEALYRFPLQMFVGRFREQVVSLKPG
jgi:hypothetical protein